VEKIRIRDPGWKKVGYGIRYPVSEKHPGSATLIFISYLEYNKLARNVSKNELYTEKAVPAVGAGGGVGAEPVLLVLALDDLPGLLPLVLHHPQPQRRIVRARHELVLDLSKSRQEFQKDKVTRNTFS
jgi:hypothetical protein